MANVFVDEKSLLTIAEAIRVKNGTEDKYKPSEMPQAILDIESGGSNPKLETDSELLYKCNHIRFAGNTFTELEMDCLYKTNMQYFCRNCPNVTTIKLSNTHKVTNWYGAFESCDNLTTIEELDFSGSTSSITALRSANIVNFKIVPNSINNPFNMSWVVAPSEESIENVINGLVDLTGATAKTLTLNADVKAKLTEEQITEITNKNWTLA